MRVAVVALLLCAAPPAFAADVAVRTGWAYGLGGEIEYRPAHWGFGVSGGYVPGLGPGGYASLVWGAHPIDESGAVLEGGVFRGLTNPLRAAPTGLGVHALAGYAFAPFGPVSVRIVVGGGLPFVGEFPSFEFLAKLTAGVAF